MSVLFMHARTASAALNVHMDRAFSVPPFLPSRPTTTKKTRQSIPSYFYTCTTNFQKKTNQRTLTHTNSYLYI